MAYMRDIETVCPQCDQQGQIRRATHAVFSATNSAHGTFCYKHASRLVQTLDQAERALHLRASDGPSDALDPTTGELR